MPFTYTYVPTHAISASSKHPLVFDFEGLSHDFQAYLKGVVMQIHFKVSMCGGPTDAGWSIWLLCRVRVKAEGSSMKTLRLHRALETDARIRSIGAIQIRIDVYSYAFHYGLILFE